MAISVAVPRTPHDASLVEALPVELWDHVAPFLTGWELVHLMHVSHHTLSIFSQSKWWETRLSPHDGATADTYAGHHSFAFAADDHKRGQLALTAAFSIPFLFGRDVQSFSVDVWFALQGDVHDGILLGAGTPFHVSPTWNPLFEVWIHIDEHRSLFSSLLSPAHGAQTQPVAQRLKRDRWHHLAITFNADQEGANDDHGRVNQWRAVGEECVYLNGQLVATHHGALSRFWVLNSFVLLGTGCRSNGAQSTGSKQWFPFRGVVDDLRIWHQLLKPSDIEALSACSNESHALTAHAVRSWKQLALAAAPRRREGRCIEFRGSHASRLRSRGVSISVVNSSNFQRGLMEDRLEFHPFCPNAHGSFALEVWFSLLPEDDKNWGGGVILGAQSRDSSDPYTPTHVRPLIFVDRQRNLYVSVLDEIVSPAAKRLPERRWHHLVLRYQDGQQDVILNGNLKRSTHGALLRNWNSLTHMQVGTGCMKNSGRGLPLSDFKGWYGFHGQIRELRIWGPRLKDRQLVSILNSSHATHIGTVKGMKPVFSLQRDGKLPHFMSVQCTRPNERVYMKRNSRQTKKLEPIYKLHSSKEHDPTDDPIDALDALSIASDNSRQPSTHWFKSMWRRATTLSSH